jgi:hypothetical protein
MHHDTISVPAPGNDDHGPGGPRGPEWLDRMEGLPSWPRRPGTDALAVAAFITVWFMAPAGVILGLVSCSRNARDGYRKDGLAKAAVWIGCIGMALGLLIVVALASSAGSGTVGG